MKIVLLTNCHSHLVRKEIVIFPDSQQARDTRDTRDREAAADRGILRGFQVGKKDQLCRLFKQTQFD